MATHDRPERAGSDPSSARPVPRALLVLLLLVTLAVATAYGALLLLPLHIVDLGGDEADYGLVTAAAALPAAVVLGLLVRYPVRFAPHSLLAVSAAVYAVAAAAVSRVDTVGPALVALGLVLGTAWAAAYAVAPMVISDLVPDGSRARAIGYVTGTVQVGFGLGPVLGGALHREGVSYPSVFLVGAALAATGAVLVLPLSRRVRKARTVVSDAASVGPDPDVGLGRVLVRIFRSPAATPLAMVLLGACLFTTMNSFQTTFADDRGLDYDVFYAAYTVAVIAVRLGLSPFLGDSASDTVVRASTAGMVVAVAGFVLVGGSVVAYGALSALLGATYGLALPAVQARAVNFAGPSERSVLLPLAGLLFEVAILVFPLVAGLVIRSGGYELLFAVLLGLSVAVGALGLRSAPRPHDRGRGELDPDRRRPSW